MKSPQTTGPSFQPNPSLARPFHPPSANMECQRIRHLLCQHPLFAGSSSALIDQLLASGQTRHFQRGATLQFKGDRPNHLLLLCSGSLKESCICHNGEEHVLEILETGAMTAEWSLFDEIPLPFSIVAAANSEVFAIDRRFLRDWLSQDPAFALRLMRHLAGRIVRLIEDIGQQALQSPLARIADYLLERAKTGAATTIILPAPKRLIAARLGISAEAFSRSLRDLADAGILSVDQQCIEIARPDRLREWAGQV